LKPSELPTQALRLFSALCLSLLLTSEPALAAKAPNFQLPGDHLKRPVALKRYRNKVVYVDFWASWCTPCKQSFPWMNEMQERYGSQGFKIIAISLDEDRKDAENFLKKVKANFIIAYDPSGETAEKYKLDVMPTSYIIDRRGKIAHIHKGFKISEKAGVEAIIKKLLKKK